MRDGRATAVLQSRDNARRYMSEIATAIGELKLKNAEVWPTVQIVSRLHCTYAEFAPALILQLKKVFEPAFSETCPDRRERISRRRSTLRLLYERATATCCRPIAKTSLLLPLGFELKDTPGTTWRLWVWFKTPVFSLPPFATH